MSGKEILVDTNIVLYLLNGSNTLAELLQGKNIYLSFITELELIGFKNISAQEEIQIKQIINDCTIISLNNTIKAQYVDIRKKYHLKLADATIAATAIALDLPLLTADKQFKTINELTLITYKHSIDLT